MPPILGSNLVDKHVMTSDGTSLGELYNVTMELGTGDLVDLVVEPDDDADYGGQYPVDEAGRYHVPADRILGVKDYITVE